jgi:hypothetical protein
MASNRPGFYRSEVGYPSPTSSQNLASKNAQYLPKMDKIHYYRHKINKNPNYIKKTTLCLIWAQPPKVHAPGHYGCLHVARRCPCALAPLSGWLLVCGVGIGPRANNLTRAPFLDGPDWLVVIGPNPPKNWPYPPGLPRFSLGSHGSYENNKPWAGAKPQPFPPPFKLSTKLK